MKLSIYTKQNEFKSINITNDFSLNKIIETINNIIFDNKLLLDNNNYNNNYNNYNNDKENKSNYSKTIIEIKSFKLFGSDNISSKVKKQIIKYLDKIFCKANNLSVLKNNIEDIAIINFELENIPKFITYLPKLITLNLKNNNITNIPSNIKKQSIINLNLSNNNIKEVKYLPNNILTLSLNSNKIEHFYDLNNYGNTKHKYKLKFISLMNNNLKSYKFYVLDNSLESLSLSFNPNLSSNLFYLGKNIRFIDIDYTNIKYINNRSKKLKIIDNINYLNNKKKYRNPNIYDYKLIRCIDKSKLYLEYKNIHTPLYIENTFY